ncbi:unnamed protein product [Urochloa humidicola]
MPLPLLRDPATLLPSLAAAPQPDHLLRALHAHLLVSGRLATPPDLAAFVAAASTTTTHLAYARLLLPRRPATLRAHNALLRALARGPSPDLAFASFRDLPLPPDHYSLTFLVRAAAALAAAPSAAGAERPAAPRAGATTKRMLVAVAASAHGATRRTRTSRAGSSPCTPRSGTPPPRGPPSPRSRAPTRSAPRRWSGRSPRPATWTPRGTCSTGCRFGTTSRGPP